MMDEETKDFIRTRLPAIKDVLNNATFEAEKIQHLVGLLATSKENFADDLNLVSKQGHVVEYLAQMAYDEILSIEKMLGAEPIKPMDFGRDPAYAWVGRGSREG